MSRSIRCALGLHDYSSWQDIDPCRKIIACKRCGRQLDESISHDPDWWTYKREDSCEQVQVCRKCGAELEKRTKHKSVVDWKIAGWTIERDLIAHYSSYYGQTSNEDDCTYEFHASSGTCQSCGSMAVCEHPEEEITGTVGSNKLTCGYCGAEGRLTREVQRGGTYNP